MAYNTKELKKKVLSMIGDKNLRPFFISDLQGMLGISISTFYVHFPKESEDYKEITEGLNQNKVATKMSMRAKWSNAKAPALQIALMKLISTPEERKLMSVSYVDIESQGKSIAPSGPAVDLSKVSMAALLELRGSISFNPDDTEENLEEEV